MSTSSWCQVIPSPSSRRPQILPVDVVAVDVRPRQVLQSTAAIDIAPGDGGSFGAWVSDHGRLDRRRSATTLRTHDLRTFLDAPTVVSPRLDAVHHLPELPADVAQPEISCDAIERHPPRVPESVGPDLRSGAGSLDERIVGRNTVSCCVARMIDVDTKHGRQEIADVLAGVVDVRRRGGRTVSRRDVEIAVGPELQAPAVVAAGAPCQQDLFTIRIDARRICRSHTKLRDARPFRQIRPQDVADVAEPVRRKSRVEGEPVNGRQAVDVGRSLQQPPRRFDRLISFKQMDHATAFDNADLLSVRVVDHLDRLVEGESRKQPLDSVRRRRVRRAGDSRRRPMSPLCEADSSRSRGITERTSTIVRCDDTRSGNDQKDEGDRRDSVGFQIHAIPQALEIGDDLTQTRMS